MKLNEIASAIAKVEGHKSQSRISDIEKILLLLSDLSYKSPEPLNAIIKLGIQRAVKKPKPKVDVIVFSNEK